MKKYAGEEFLNKLYKDLIHSDEVKHTAKGANKNEDLAIYLERLERITNEVRNKDRLELLKHFYYKKYVIKEEKVPESYFETLERVALERGYGHNIYDEITKKSEISSIITEQKESLDKWLEYFVSEETTHYPIWFKYYVFQNIMKIGYFDKEKAQFTKRTDSTVKPFVEINREAISMLYDELYKYLDKKDLSDTQLEQLIKNGSFNKIYSYIITKLEKIKKTGNISDEGIWKKYDMGSNPEILFNDIHGKGTGWCTAGGLETARTHINGGDFYVYFTKDERGEYTIPRIAIRMDYNKIAEIRGVAESQNLENEMESIVEEKLEEFPDKEEYKKKVDDMKLLTNIYSKNKNGENLTLEELKFLYEIDFKIIGFGYGTDPRIEEIKTSRSLRKDLAVIYNLKLEEVSLDIDEALQGNKKLHVGNLALNGCLEIIKGVTLPEEVMGSVYLERIEDAKDIILPRKIGGYLKLIDLKSAKGVIFPKQVGSLDLRNLTSPEGLVLPKQVGGLDLRSLIGIKGLVWPEIITGDLILDGLTDLEGLILPKVNGLLSLNGLTSAKGLVLPEVSGPIMLNGLKDAKDLILPNIVRGSLHLKNLKSSDGLVLPKEISIGVITLSSLVSAEGLEFPKGRIIHLYLDSLETANGLKLPRDISGKLVLNSLNDPEGIILPKNEHGEFYVPGRELWCPFTKEELIEAAKRTEARQQSPKIFEEIDESLNSNALKI